MKKGPMKITAAQKKLPANLQKAIIAKEKKEGKFAYANIGYNQYTDEAKYYKFIYVPKNTEVSSKCNKPKNPHLNPKPNADDVSGS